MAKKSEGEEGKKIKKVDMMRDAFATLGMDAELSAIQSYIKDKYGEDLTKAHISQTKTSERKKAGGTTGKRGRKPKGEVVVSSAATEATLDIADVLALFAEIQRYKEKIGAKNVQKVVAKALL